MSPFLRDFWYLAVLGRRLRPDRTLPVRLLGQPILLGRRPDGSVFAFLDSCPHRGMPMHHGQCRDAALRCGYHGWNFSTQDGRCIEIPALTPDDTIEPGRFRLRQFPCREVQGNVWVFMAAQPDAPPDPLPPVPTVPGFDGVAPQVAATLRFPCEADIATMGFIDPAHPAFVHTSRWWKSKPSTSLRLKEKHFEPDGLGFRMQRHHLKEGANPYRLLGRKVHVDVAIALPGLRIEHISGERHSACVLAASTPVETGETDVHYCVYWTMPWLAPVRPVARWMAYDFLRQDYDIAVRLNDAQAPFPPPLFVGDADTQIRWFLRLKREYLASQQEARPFTNPLRPQVLHWRS